MKRDMDLCRKILIEIESWPTTLGPRPVEIDGYTDEQIGYNAWLLAQEGLIKGRDRRDRSCSPRLLSKLPHVPGS